MHEAIKKALEVLRNGGVILYPTDTVWGIGCDATNDEAVKRVRQIKQRNDDKSLIVMLDSLAKLDRYVVDAPDLAYDLIEMSEKPLTIIYEQSKGLSSYVSLNDKSVGIRITNEAFSQRLLEQFKRPVVSTSANKCGETTPLCFGEITQEIKAAVDYVVEFRQDDKRATPSSIIMLSNNGTVKVLRG